MYVLSVQSPWGGLEYVQRKRIDFFYKLGNGCYTCMNGPPVSRGWLGVYSQRNWTDTLWQIRHDERYWLIRHNYTAVTVSPVLKIFQTTKLAGWSSKLGKVGVKRSLPPWKNSHKKCNLWMSPNRMYMCLSLQSPGVGWEYVHREKGQTFCGKSGMMNSIELICRNYTAATVPPVVKIFPTTKWAGEICQARSAKAGGATQFT